MKDENQFSIRDVIKTAWHNLKGAKWAIWAPQLVMILIYIGLAITFMTFATATGVMPHAGMEISIGFYSELVIFWIIAIFLASPLTAGIQMTALKKVRGEKINGRTGFAYWHQWIPLGFVVLLISMGQIIINQIFAYLTRANQSTALFAETLALIAICIILIYLIFFMFSLLFVADKHKGPWSALGHSAKMLTSHWFRIIVLMLFIAVLIIIASLPAILGVRCPIIWVRVLGILVSIVAIIWLLPYWNLILSTIYYRLSS